MWQQLLSSALVCSLLNQSIYSLRLFHTFTVLRVRPRSSNKVSGPTSHIFLHLKAREDGILEYKAISWDQHRHDDHYYELSINLSLCFLHLLAAVNGKLDMEYDLLNEEKLPPQRKTALASPGSIVFEHRGYTPNTPTDRACTSFMSDRAENNILDGQGGSFMSSQSADSMTTSNSRKRQQSGGDDWIRSGKRVKAT